MTRFLFSVLFIIAVLSVSTAARADDTSKSDSAALKKLGDNAMDSLRYDEALRYYSDAYAKYPDPAILYNRGRVYGARGDYPAALGDLEHFDHDASPELHAKVPALTQLIAEMASHVATVTFTCDQADARVVVRDKALGTTPLKPIRLSAGKADIEVTKDGYQPIHETRDLPGGKALDVAYTLLLVETQGILAIKTPGVNAGLALDGKAVGTTPFEGKVDEGQHKVVLRADGYDDLQSTAVVVIGERKELSLEMKKKPTLVTRWWFWTGVGAVAVATVVIVIAATTEKSPSSGDHFSPGQVRGPLTIAF